MLTLLSTVLNSYYWLGGSLGLLIYCSDRAWPIFIKPAAHDCWNVCMGRIVRPKREIIFSDFNQGEVFVIPYAVTFDAMNIAQYHYSMLFNSFTRYSSLIIQEIFSITSSNNFLQYTSSYQSYISNLLTLFITFIIQFSFLIYALFFIFY